MSTTFKVIKSLAKVAPSDHRIIGANQNLFFFHPASKGSCFFLPRGARIYNKLVNFLRCEYQKRGYEEVITPNIYSCRLWEESGHWEHYKDNMIKFNLGDHEFSMKPMNCPGHCLMFKNQRVSLKQLPIRWADFGVLHRDEPSGSLLGLSRVRRFQQDDAHIFCTSQQVEDEVKSCLDFAKYVYGKFGFSIDVFLSLRPEKYLGESDLWDKAEHSLRQALDKSEMQFEEQKFEGAFYGPKIDLSVKDNQNRSQQCATIQLDFQLPERFKLQYHDTNENSPLRPVMIHRAILGSVERFIAMLAEHYEGHWPFWLSPLQAQVIPINDNQIDYAKQVETEFRELGFWVDSDVATDKLNAKIRNASLKHYNLILLVGSKEESDRSVTCRLVRSRQSSVGCQASVESGNNFDKQDKKFSNNSLSVHNLTIPLDKLKKAFVDYERRYVDKADIELLNDYGGSIQ